MEKIKSFEIDHTALKKGIYISSARGDIITIDLRLKTPYKETLLSDSAMHSLEHCLASRLRSGKSGHKIVYVGPMGCRTGFYCIFKEMTGEEILNETQRAFKFLAEEKYSVPGSSMRECGYYFDLDAAAAKKTAAEYYGVIKDKICFDEYP